MPLPNAHKAVVEIVKLKNYCLSFEHPEGRHKARVFQTALGLTGADAEELRAALLQAAREQDAIVSAADTYGQRYAVDAIVRHRGREAIVRSAWIIRRGEDFPRLTSCYVL